VMVFCAAGKLEYCPIFFSVNWGNTSAYVSTRHHTLREWAYVSIRAAGRKLEYFRVYFSATWGERTREI
jgi:hypothetical protein